MLAPAGRVAVMRALRPSPCRADHKFALLPSPHDLAGGWRRVGPGLWRRITRGAAGEPHARLCAPYRSRMLSRLRRGHRQSGAPWSQEGLRGSAFKQSCLKTAKALVHTSPGRAHATRCRLEWPPMHSPAAAAPVLRSNSHPGAPQKRTVLAGWPPPFRRTKALALLATTSLFRNARPLTHRPIPSILVPRPTAPPRTPVKPPLSGNAQRRPFPRAPPNTSSGGESSGRARRPATFSVPPCVATTCVVPGPAASSHTAPYCSASRHSGCDRGSASRGITRLNTRRQPASTRRRCASMIARTSHWS